MVKIVLDTNVLVSAILTPDGSPGRVLELVADSSVHLVVSPSILTEYEEVLSRKKFRLTQTAVHAILDSLTKLATEIVPSEAIRACSDAGDDKFLECAYAAGVSRLITGNQKHFPRNFGTIRILSPASFIQEIEGL